MKKHLTNAIGKKVFTLLTASFILFGSATTSFALPDRANKAITAAEISYQGMKDKFLVFKMDYKNELAQPFELQIRNEDREIIYAKKFDSRPLNTDILFSDIPDNGKLIFTIVTGKTEITKSFEINNNFKTIQDVAVKGL